MPLIATIRQKRQALVRMSDDQLTDYLKNPLSYAFDKETSQFYKVDDPEPNVLSVDEMITINFDLSTDLFKQAFERRPYPDCSPRMFCQLAAKQYLDANQALGGDVWNWFLRIRRSESKDEWDNKPLFYQPFINLDKTTTP